MTPDQIATLSVPELDAAVIEKCKELREVEGRATEGPWRQHGSHFYGPDAGHQLIGQMLYSNGEDSMPLLLAARNSFLAHLDAMEALVGWRCGRCEGTGERTMCGSGQLLPCPSCAPIVTIKREWLGKMMEVRNAKG